MVIGGHQRLVAARRAGFIEVPVTFLDITQEQARLLNFALNLICGRGRAAHAGRGAPIIAPPPFDPGMERLGTSSTQYG